MMIEFQLFSNISINSAHTITQLDLTIVFIRLFSSIFNYLSLRFIGMLKFSQCFPFINVFQNISEISLFLCHSLSLMYFFLSGQSVHYADRTSLAKLVNSETQFTKMYKVSCALCSKYTLCTTQCAQCLQSTVLICKAVFTAPH